MSTDMGIDFDANGVPPEQPFELLPAGWYYAMVVASEVKPTNDNTGKYAELTWQVIDGPAKGRKVWQRITLLNNSAKAVEIGMGQLSAVCHATGVLRANNTALFHDRPCWLKVKVRPAEGEYEASNDVAGCKPANDPPKGVGPGVPQAAAPAAPPAPPAPAHAAPPAAPATMAQPAPAYPAPAQPAAPAQPSAPAGVPPAAPTTQPWG